ncbi:transaldolase family protein [Streptomyces sp. NPDC058964]|uniref:transaldolase family protein n=1 Tax=Streptomyces sp. NPDC058964 TaxID=3346681 RepID=UPI0036A7A119
MISRSASAMLQQLAAEGVAPWLSADATTDFDVDVLSHLARRELVAGAVLTGGPPAALHRVCDALLPVFLATDGRAGHVSVALTAGRGTSAEDLLDAARSLHERVGRANFLVRLPVDAGGLMALRDCLAQGIGVQAGPVYSEERYGQLLAAFFAGMERALAAGLPLHEITLVAGVPVGRLDDSVNARLEAVYGPRADAARDTAAVALARCMYGLREDRLSSDWWRVIRTGGAQLPLLLWTDPAPRHMADLVGANTAHLLSLERLEKAAVETELAGEALMGSASEGRHALKELAVLGIDMETMARELELSGQRGE